MRRIDCRRAFCLPANFNQFCIFRSTSPPTLQSHSAAGDLASVPQSGATAGGSGGPEEKQPPASATSPPISAAATVVRVPPTVSSSNGTTASAAAAPGVATSEFGGHPGTASVSTSAVVSAAVPPQQSRQMAEIRPMPSVACVMPTPAPAEQQPSGLGTSLDAPQVTAVVQQQPQSQTQNLQMSSVVSITVSQPMNVAQSSGNFLFFDDCIAALECEIFELSALFLPP